MVRITRKAEFSASHFLANPEWTPEENERVYGVESRPCGHGHNFVLEVTVGGEPDPVDGMVMDLKALKEIINRGGEKVSPLEVDDILSSHPAVAQALTFAMPHKKLGEEVAAAIVLREGKTADEAEIRAFAAEHLADFKVPRKVVFLDEIPKGATGKLQRIGLAEKLGLGS